MDLVPKPLELAPSTLNLFNSIVKKETSLEGKSNKCQIFPHLLTHKKIFYPVYREEKKKTPVNLKNLEWLIETTRNIQEIELSHRNFMENYQKMFEKDAPKTKTSDSPRINVFDRLFAQSKHAPLRTSVEESETSNKLDQIENKKTSSFESKSRRGSIDEIEKEKLKIIKKLRNLVKKYPFERSDEENKQICEILSNVDEFLDTLPPNLRHHKKFLSEFASCAQFESVNLKHSQIFGNFGFYLILKGSVRPLTSPHLNRHQTKIEGTTPELFEDDHDLLKAGGCFGTLAELPGRDLTTRMFRVLTLEDKSEFLKLSTESYKKISKKILEEEKIEKLNTIKNCPGYDSWPKHSVEELITVFEWRHFSANTILTNEGFLAPFIAFIDDGSCHVLRKVDITSTNKKTGLTEKHIKQVVVGKLDKCESFGEFSCLLKEPMTCTIVTETPCHVGVITYEKANRLDNLTQRLLIQTAKRTFADLTQKEIHEKHIAEEKRKMWKEYKTLIVDDTIKKYGIEPGKGKYGTPKIETRFNVQRRSPPLL